MADVEYSFNHCQNSKDKNIYTAQTTNIITNYLHKDEKQFSLANEWFHITQQFLKQHPG